MSTTQEPLAANERYDALVTALRDEIKACELVVRLPKYDEWDRGYRAGALRMQQHLLSILEHA